MSNNATYELHHHKHLRSINDFFLISIRVELTMAQKSVHLMTRTASLF
jgi:hypothetical protein